MNLFGRAAGFGLQAAQLAGAVRIDPFAPYRFLFELDGLICGGFSRVDGIGASIDVDTYAEGGRHQAPHHLLGAVQWDRLVLTAGLGLVDTLWRWFEATARGALQPRSGMIMLLGTDSAPRVLWEFREALPVVWKGPTLDASTSEVVAIETLELVHQGISQPIPRAAGAALGALTGGR